MIMEALMSRLEDWRHLLSDILEPALVLRSHRTVVDVCSLLRALKVGCSGCVELALVHGSSVWEVGGGRVMVGSLGERVIAGCMSR